jgi:hypothetical protein
MIKSTGECLFQDGCHVPEFGGDKLSASHDDVQASKNHFLGLTLEVRRLHLCLQLQIASIDDEVDQLGYDLDPVLLGVSIDEDLQEVGQVRVCLKDHARIDDVGVEFGADHREAKCVDLSAVREDVKQRLCEREAVGDLCDRRVQQCACKQHVRASYIAR